MFNAYIVAWSTTTFTGGTQRLPTTTPAVFAASGMWAVFLVCPDGDE